MKRVPIQCGDFEFNYEPCYFAQYLLQEANKHLSSDNSCSQNKFKKLQTKYCFKYLSEFLKDGASQTYLKKIDKKILELEFKVRFYRSRSGISTELIQVPDCNFILSGNDIFKPTDFFLGYTKNFDKLENFIAYLTAVSISSENLRELNQCKLDECKRFFLGRKNQKWCSDNCGSKYRVKKQRKKQKIRRNAF